MSAESPRHMRSGGPLTVPSQPPPDRSIIDAVSGFINDVKLTSPTVDPKDVIQWARFETADINEPTSEADSDTDISPLLLILGYGTGVQVWLIPPTGEAQEVLSWRQGTVRVLRILPTPNRGDCFTSKRPLIALCDSVSPGPSFCSLSFISIRGGEQVKSIKFKNPILDVLANKRSVVISFSERFAVFDAATLEDRMAVTTCYPCPCPLGGATPVNPLALGERWLAYADKKLNPSKRSSGGCESEGQTSYTATVLHAAKSLSKGLRGLGESVAQSLAGTRATSQSPSPPHSDLMQPGVVTVLDIEGIEEEDGQDAEDPCDPIVAHFVAHSEAVTALTFDASGLVLVTADRRGHDFHVFRLNPHPCGPALAAVHHLYVLHRGDTTAKVQDIAISCDCRWAAVSTLRGTTHVFAVAPYGGAAGVRTHTQARVVNRLSRFHRSAGLPIHCGAKPASPVGEGAGAWFPNPRLPPYPQPALCTPLAQLRPTANLATHTITRTSSGRQRLSSLSEESGAGAAPLLARAAWGPAGAAGAARAGSQALYLMTASGNLLHLLVHPRPANSIPKEKISDESAIEVEVEAVAQWPLQRPPAAADLIAPLPPSNPLLQPAHCARCTDMCVSEEERWLSQVEIVTHAGPHRRLWMGPQFVFKTYNFTGSNSSLSEAEAVEVESVARSNPVNMPAAVPVLVDSGSASSLEQSPSDSFRRKSMAGEPRAASGCDLRLREDLAEAMKEDHGPWEEEPGPVSAAGVALAVGPAGTVVRAAPNPAPARADPDAYTRANADEATFRPVLNAPASLPPAALPASPLPATTTIPVQSIAEDLYSLRPYTPPDDVYQTGDSVADVGRLQPVQPVDAAAGRPDENRMKVSASEEMLMELTSAAMESNLDSEIKSLKTEKQAQKEHREAAVATQNKTHDEISVPKKENVDSKIGKDKKSDSRSAKLNDAPERKPTKKELSESVREIPKFKNGGSVKPDAPESKKSEMNLAKKKLSESLKEIPEFKKEGSVRRGVSETKKPVNETKQDSCEKQRDALDFENVVPSEQKEVSDSKKSTSVLKKELRESKKVFSEQKPEKKDVSESKKESTTPKKVVAETKQETSLIKEASMKDSVVETKKYIEKDPVETTISNKVKTDFKKSPEKDIFKLDKNELVEKKDSSEFMSKKDRAATKSSNRDFSPESKLYQKNSSERESSLKRETADLKSSWKRESKLDWSLKSDSQEKPIVLKEPDVINAEQQLAAAVEIKTEDQAWDMLLNEPEKAVSTLNPQTVATEKNDESKSKSKKNRKLKKSVDEAQSKSEDDSFVEIHAIEDNFQPSSGELVSISMPYEEIESSSSYSSKTKKSRSPKNTTDKKQQPKLDDWSIEDIERDCDNKTTTSRQKSISSEIDVLLECESEALQKIETDCIKFESFESIITDSSTKDKKAKACVSSQETRLSFEKTLDVDVKDVYVIDSTKEEFPEIQITSGRGSKMRKKSPQLEVVKKTEDKEVVPERPIKSWSAIAASKNTKKADEHDIVKPSEPVSVEKKLDYNEKDIKNESKLEKKPKPSRYAVDDEPSPPLSLHEELMRLCKRTDIMVAECDAPSELNFVEEHHSLLQDLPPLDLDFGMDDFKLEVMRDSLLEVNDTKISSPICKIDIDSILSSIKESTSAFNLIDLEKVPDKKEKGFSVVENDKIRSQEVVADDDSKCDDKEIEVMEKSSDDDNTSPASADSDKDDKKTNGASNLALPSTKQSSKSKKSRRKKK